MSTDARGRLPNSGDWMFAPATDAQSATSLRLYLHGADRFGQSSGFAPPSEAEVAAHELGIEPFFHDIAVGAARQAWRRAPETRQVRQAVLELLRDQETPLTSVAAATEVARQLLADQPGAGAGDPAMVEAMVRVALDCEPWAHAPEWGARRISGRDLIVAAIRTPLTSADLGVREALTVGAKAAELGAVMFPEQREWSAPWPSKWGPMAAADLADLVLYHPDATLSTEFAMVDPYVPGDRHRTLPDLADLDRLSPPDLAGLVAAGSSRACYNRRADVLYDSRITIDLAVGHVLDRHHDAVPAWVEAGQPQLTERLETLTTGAFTEAHHRLFDDVDFGSIAATVRANFVRLAAEPSVPKAAPSRPHPTGRGRGRR